MRDAMKADKARSTVGRISPTPAGDQPSARQTGSRAADPQAVPDVHRHGNHPLSRIRQPEALRSIEARAADGRLKVVRVGLPRSSRTPSRTGAGRRLRSRARVDITIEIQRDHSLHRGGEGGVDRLRSLRRAHAGCRQRRGPATGATARRNRRREEAQATPRRPRHRKPGMRPLLPRRRPKQVRGTTRATRRDPVGSSGRKRGPVGTAAKKKRRRAAPASENRG